MLALVYDYLHYLHLLWLIYIAKTAHLFGMSSILTPTGKRFTAPPAFAPTIQTTPPRLKPCVPNWKPRNTIACRWSIAKVGIPGFQNILNGIVRLNGRL